MDASAAAIDSVNTIVNDAGVLTAYNTDYTAIAQLITLPIVAVVARLAAVSTLGLVQSEARLNSMSRERTKASELEQAKSDFMRMASHELRGPVAVLRGYLSMLADGSLGPLPDSALHVLPMLISKPNTWSGWMYWKYTA